MESPENSNWYPIHSFLCNESPRNGSNMSTAGLLNSECVIDIVSCIPPLLFIITSITILIILSSSRKYQQGISECTSTFPWHTARWLFFLGLYATNIAEIAEGILSDGMYLGVHLHLYFTPVIFLVANILANISYHHIEKRGKTSASYLLFLLAFWISALTVKFAKWLYTIQAGLNAFYMRFDLTFDNLAGYCAMITAEIVVMIKLRYLCVRCQKVEISTDANSAGQTSYEVSIFPLKCVYHWVNKLICFQYKSPLKISDITASTKEDRCEITLKKIRKVKESASLSLWRICIKVSLPMLILSGVYQFFGDLLMFTGPVCLMGIVMYIENYRHALSLNNTIPVEKQYIDYIDFYTNGYVVTVILLVLTIFAYTFQEGSKFVILRQSRRVEAALSAYVFENLLKFPTSGEKYRNFQTNSITAFFQCVHVIWAVPLQVFIAVSFLYLLLGTSGLCGVLAVVILMILYSGLECILSVIQKHSQSYSSEYYERTRELLQGFTEIKLNGWEDVFSEAIETCRKKQQCLMVGQCFLESLKTLLKYGSFLIASLVAFFFVTRVDNSNLTPSTALPSLVLYSMLSLSLIQLPIFVKAFQQAKATCCRIEERVNNAGKINENVNLGRPDNVRIKNVQITEQEISESLEVDIESGGSGDASDTLLTRKDDKGWKNSSNEEDKELGFCGFFKTSCKFLKPCVVIFLMLAAVVLCCGKTAAETVAYFWLANWSDGNMTTNETDRGRNFYYGHGFTGLVFVTLLMTFLSSLLVHLSGLRAGSHLYRKFLNTILYLPLRSVKKVLKVSETIPEDLYTMDHLLSFSTVNLLQSAMLCVTAVMISVIVLPLLILLFLPVSIVYILLLLLFKSASRELLRLDTVAQSSLDSYISQYIGESSGSNSHGIEDDFLPQLYECINDQHKVHLTLQTVLRWLNIRMGYLGAAILFISGLSVLIAALNGYISSALAGITIASLLIMMSHFNTTVHEAYAIDKHMAAIGRISNFCASDDVQTDALQTGQVGSSSATCKGEVVFSDVSLCFPDKSSPSVSNVNLKIPADSMMGICGTDDKSLLTLVMLGAARVSSGSISIDGEDVTQIPLKLLKQNIGIVQENPVLFTDTVRFNLDPSGKKTDDEIWTALETCRLKSVVTELPQRLDFVLGDKAHLNPCQKQLLCLARVVLKKCKVIVIDESSLLCAEPSLSEVLPQLKNDRTIIIATNHLSSITHCDQVAVLSRGQILECNSPNNLLRNKNSKLSEWIEAGTVQ